MRFEAWGIRGCKQTASLEQWDPATNLKYIDDCTGHSNQAVEKSKSAYDGRVEKKEEGRDRSGGVAGCLQPVSCFSVIRSDICRPRMSAAAGGVSLENMDDGTEHEQQELGKARHSWSKGSFKLLQDLETSNPALVQVLLSMLLIGIVLSL